MDEHVNDDGKSREEILAEIEENEAVLMEGMVIEIDRMTSILETMVELGMDLDHDGRMEIIREMTERLHEMNAVVRKNREMTEEVEIHGSETSRAYTDRPTMWEVEDEDNG